MMMSPPSLCVRSTALAELLTKKLSRLVPCPTVKIGHGMLLGGVASGDHSPRADRRSRRVASHFGDAGRQTRPCNPRGPLASPAHGPATPRQGSARDRLPPADP